MVKLPKIIGDIWFNSKPLKSQDLIGKVILIDFWTYTCVNCLRTIPHLHRLWHKYKDKGLVMIGIHTPEFEFEKDPQNVERAIRDLHIHWPIVLDNNYVNWNNFANRFWPAKYITDREGKIVYEHFGEGAYEETEKVIQKLLAGRLDKLPLVDIGEEEHLHGQACFIPTPELYCGYGRGTLSNPTYFYDQIADYTAPEVLVEDSIALAGKFYAAYEYVESAEVNATIVLKFVATEVNLVMRPVTPKAEVGILLNKETIPENLSGSDVQNQGIVIVNGPRMYNLLKSNYMVDGVLDIVAKTGNFQAYAFTFSGCPH